MRLECWPSKSTVYESPSEMLLSHLIIESNETAPSETLHIVCNRQVAQNRIFPCLGKFLENYPAIVTNVSIMNHLNNVDVNHFNLAIGYEPEECFNHWRRRKMDELSIYYQTMEPMDLKVKVFIDYLRDYLTALKK
jgi:hypothetical protein